LKEVLEKSQMIELDHYFIIPILHPLTLPSPPGERDGVRGNGFSRRDTKEPGA
jgi:hypothetical protein